jgi:protein-S-isoprenylcysteine O-methyltransferase Ste14
MSKRIVQVTLFTTLWIVALFVAAGRWDWTRGWLFVALYLAGMGALAAIVRRTQPDLLAARAQWRRKDAKPFDKVFLAIFAPLATAQPAVAGLDVERFHWSSMPPRVLYAGIALFVPAFALMAWAMAVNPHAETTVRIQTDRGHRVVTAGPYRFVRHPMYVGAMLLYVASALVLGSLWALVTAGLIAGALVCRTALEDRTLRRELPGYEDFASRTRYRLVPGLW